MSLVFLQSVKSGALLFLAVLLSSCAYDEDAAPAPGDVALSFTDRGVWQEAKWLALGDSDFDSYQADDFRHRVNPDALNTSCVLSPIDVLARDGKDVGQYAKWDDARRSDFRFNYSRSGATVRSTLFGWRDRFTEDWYDGIKQIARELRSSLQGYEYSLYKSMLAELETLNDNPEVKTKPVIVQINIGINDINGYPSMYEQFTSNGSHYSWVDLRTNAIRNAVDEILDVYPGAVIVLWQLLDDGGWGASYSIEQEEWITSHTHRWNENLWSIADARPGVVVFEVNAYTRKLLGRMSDGTDRDIILDGTRYIRAYIPESADTGEVDNTRYMLTRDGHGNTVLSALYIREIIRLLNDKFGAGLSPFSPASVNTITCQQGDALGGPPVLEIPPDVAIDHEKLPYTLGRIVAYDASENDISDSAVAVSDKGGNLFGDGQNLQLRPARHGRGEHHITITVRDAQGLSVARNTTVLIK